MAGVLLTKLNCLKMLFTWFLIITSRIKWKKVVPGISNGDLHTDCTWTLLSTSFDTCSFIQILRHSWSHHYCAKHMKSNISASKELQCVQSPFESNAETKGFLDSVFFACCNYSDLKNQTRGKKQTINKQTNLKQIFQWAKVFQCWESLRYFILFKAKKAKHMLDLFLFSQSIYLNAPNIPPKHFTGEPVKYYCIREIGAKTLRLF